MREDTILGSAMPLPSDTFICDYCGGEFPQSRQMDFRGRRYCQQCLDRETTVCSHCGCRIWTSGNAGTVEAPLCNDCFTNHYFYCHHCGALLRCVVAYYENDDSDNSVACCYSCHYRHSSHDLPYEDALHEYSYKPVPHFYGRGPRYFGVELEIDHGGEDTSNAEVLTDRGNCLGCEHIYCKRDGSLEDGLEIVTHPMSLDYHMDEMPWDCVIQEAVQLGYRSHQTGTCGLHIHVSRAAFGWTESEQDIRIARILYFFEKHWEELLKFSRRTNWQLERWAARYGFKEHPREILDHAKKRSSKGRYTCVNLENDNTIEFRIFRGTLKLNTLLATLQLVDRICDVAISMTDAEIKALSWTSFVSSCTRPELIQYLKERQLYVNDPVESEVEV